MSSVAVPTVRVEGEGFASRADQLAVEEPLEIRVGARSLSITMRTPGHDVDLALGFLVSEGIVRGASDIEEAKHCGPAVRDDATSNIVRIKTTNTRYDLERLERHFYTSSSCGVCGKTSLEAVRLAAHARVATGPRVAPSMIHGLPARLRDAQDTFDRTGGLHAAGLFDAKGELLTIREDVGRHNAVDKVIGHHLQHGQLPLSNHLLLVSGRASFELVQKAVMAGIPILAAVGAPSSLAVELARAEGVTILGFVRNERFNVYCGEERIEGAT